MLHNFEFICKHVDTHWSTHIGLKNSLSDFSFIAPFSLNLKKQVHFSVKNSFWKNNGAIDRKSETSFFIPISIDRVPQKGLSVQVNLFANKLKVSS